MSEDATSAKESQQVCVRLAPELLTAVDERIEAGEYRNRSAVVRDGIRELTGVEGRGREGGL